MLPVLAGSGGAPVRGDDPWIEELERDLGEPARRRLVACLGGQRRHVPLPGSAAGSRLAAEAGADIAAWLAGRFGGTVVDIPSARGRAAEAQANHLRAAILDAGLDNPTRSANDLADEFGVTSMWVRKLRSRLKAERNEERR